MIKQTKTYLRIWITATALVAMGLGWTVLAHSPKPAPLLGSQTASASSLAAQLPPIPSLQQLEAGSSSASSRISLNFSAPPSSFASAPVLRTMGS